MNLNRELTWICSLLSKYNVKFWIDSGTLLGLVREGGVIKDDHDIDISLWSAGEPLLSAILPAVRSRGYRVSVKNYRGLKFKYKFTPQFESSSLDIDISLFRREENHAWCPLVYCLPYPCGRSSPAFYLQAVPRKLIQELFIRVPAASLHRWPWTLSYRVYTMWIPERFFTETIFLHDGVPAPKAFEEYLSFRYGQWKVPREDWFYIFDDGAVKQASPETMIRGL